jgi:hypothetical protein
MKEAWEIMVICSCAKKILQLRRLQKQSQPWEQLDAVIEEIMELMIRSAETASKERLSRRRAAAAAAAAAATARMEQMESSKDLFGIQEDFQQLRGEAHEQELMILQLRSLMQEHLSTSASQPASHVSAFIQAEERGAASFKFEFNVI